ncbi:putative clathrin assembly protein [Cucumis melo var. makuwa]|uniref:Clathrin assembly protein n=2 Tax=Cucumis melo TaxID=3656 RepID=A0A5D3DTU8_CUCMM|nr:putative clathrin assembly protein [Cucumis melo var. makuwa]TYK27126.1 putative clathrin assembly protein [Cucumis melo var. makuwa]
MKLWRKAAGAIKDRNSIWLASLSRRTPYRHPDLEAAIIRATSHDGAKIDYTNARRVFEWIRTSPVYLKPLAWGLSSRMEKTRSWVVALKGLMLIHGVFCCQIPSVQRIGRLPFDLSGFKDGHSSPSKTWGYDAFVRSYYAYLDQKSAFISSEAKNLKKALKPTLLDELIKLQRWQSMLDMLLQVRPLDENMKVGLVLEAMNNLIVEVFDVYSRICNGIAQALLKIYASPAKSEASMALRVVQKAATQVEDLSQYLEVCREMGVLNASQCPKLENIPKEDVKELEQIINGSANNNNNTNGKRENCEHFEEEKIHEEIIMSGIRKKGSNNKRVLKTVITDKWEIFDGDCSSRTTLQDQHHFPNCYSSHLSVVSLPNHKQDLPDLITF